MTRQGGASRTPVRFAPASRAVPRLPSAQHLEWEDATTRSLSARVGQDLAEAGIAVQLAEGVDNLEAILGFSADGRAQASSSTTVPRIKESR